MRNSGPFFVIRLSFTLLSDDEKFCLLTFWFLKGVPAGQGVVWDYSITDFPPASGVVLAFFSASTPPTLPFPGRNLAHMEKYHFLGALPRLKKKNKLTNIPLRKIKRNGYQTCCAWRMGFIRERGLTVSVRGARNETNPYLFCIHLSSYNSYQLSITDTRLSIVGW